MCTYFSGKTYSVGDGFCYEGIIRGKTCYHFVIDCGSKFSTNKNVVKARKANKTKKLNSKAECEQRLEEITTEIANKGETINLFVLSHLHQDHYNGYLKLFSKTKVDTIIMPYLYPEERLCMLVNCDMDKEEALFCANPYQRILDAAHEKNPETKLVLVRGSNGEQESEFENTYVENERVSWGDSYEDSENILAIEGLEAKHTEIVKVSSKGVRLTKPNWFFKFFNVEVDETVVGPLKKIVGTLDAKRLYDIIVSELAKVKKEYQKIAADLRNNNFNNTSVVVYHAPYCSYEVCCRRISEKMTCRCGSLITGDIDLNYYSQDILKFFQNEMKTVGLFSIPHHGSKNNWNIDFINNGALDGSVCFSSSYNYYSNRLVPDMLADLRSHNIQVLVVDENRFSEFEQEIFATCYGICCKHYVHELYRPSRYGGCVAFWRMI